MLDRLKAEYHRQYVRAFENLRHEIARCEASVSNVEVNDIIEAVDRLNRWKARREDCLSIKIDEPDIQTILAWGENDPSGV